MAQVCSPPPLVPHQEPHQAAGGGRILGRAAEAEETSGRREVRARSAAGWADTDAVRASLPQFYESLKDKLRSPEQGADTVAWLCLVDQAKLTSGAFYFDRSEVPKHLALSWTDYRSESRDELVRLLGTVAGLEGVATAPPAK